MSHPVTTETETLRRAPTSWLLKRAERALSVALTEGLREFNLTPAQYGVLQALARLGKASSAELARAVFVTPQAMTGLVAGLERQKLIRRRPVRSSRVIEATLTPLGTRVYAAARQRFHEIDDQLTADLDDAERDALRSALQRCVESLEVPERRNRRRFA